MKTSSGQGEIFAFFALLRKISKRNEFASQKNFRCSLRFRFAIYFKKKFAFASLSQSTFGQNLDPWSKLISANLSQVWPRFQLKLIAMRSNLVFGWIWWQSANQAWARLRLSTRFSNLIFTTSNLWARLKELRILIRLLFKNLMLNWKKMKCPWFWGKFTVKIVRSRF